MPILVDATVLSNLAAVDRLDLLRLLSAPLYLTSAVYEEIQQGVDEGYDFLVNIDKALDSGLLSLISPENESEWHQYRDIPDKLQRGEAMSLAIARCRGWRLLTDDRAARMYAEQSSVSYSGTLGLLRYAVQNGHLTLEDGNALLAGMITRARYRSPVSDLRALLKDES
jgi:predicted nucleic acid-binding protein